MDMQTVVGVSPDHISSMVGEEVVILSLQKGMYYGLNPTGARIWEFVQEPVQIGQIHQRLLGEYDIDEETARRDLFAVIGQLVESGLVEVRRATAS